jgi:hypothetical protein
MTSEEFAIRRVRWQLFATLTFRSEKKSQRHRYGLLFAWLRQLANSKEVHFKRLLWAVRAEAGENFGRFHYHVLVGGLPVHEVNPSTCQFFERLWKSVLGVGIADVREWEAGRDAVSYVLKGIEGGTVKGGNAYESGKFAQGRHTEVTLAQSMRQTLLTADLKERAK